MERISLKFVFLFLIVGTLILFLINLISAVGVDGGFGIDFTVGDGSSDDGGDDGGDDGSDNEDEDNNNDDNVEDNDDVDDNDDDDFKSNDITGNPIVIKTSQSNPKAINLGSGSLSVSLGKKNDEKMSNTNKMALNIFMFVTTILLAALLIITIKFTGE